LEWWKSFPFMICRTDSCMVTTKWEIQRLLSKRTVKHDVKINVWGCFTVSGFGDLHLIEENMDHKQYKQLLLHHMISNISRFFPNPPHCIFLQVNDPKHTANVVQHWIHNTRNICVLLWPSQSPDLNQIENLSAFINKKIKN